MPVQWHQQGAEPIFIKILGTAAGGGFPQWNCRCAQCQAARAGEISPRLQASAAISPDGAAWYLVNATPDVTAQLLQHPELHPRHGNRETPFAGILLTDAELDHALGLMHLREGDSLRLYGTAAVRAALQDELGFLPNLARYTEVDFVTVAPGEQQLLPGNDGAGLEVEWFETGQDLPRYAGEKSVPGAVTGLELRDPATGRIALYIPGAGELTPELLERMERAEAIFLDGTFWSEDEFPKVSGRTRSAKDMGHLPMSGEGGTAASLAELPARIKKYVHINNTNPVLHHGSPEREHLRSLGLDLAQDGEEVEI